MPVLQGFCVRASILFESLLYRRSTLPESRWGPIPRISERASVAFFLRREPAVIGGGCSGISAGVGFVALDL